MKKLTLKKEVVARLNNDNMSQVKGGLDESILTACATACNCPSKGCVQTNNGCPLTVPCGMTVVDRTCNNCTTQAQDGCIVVFTSPCSK